MRVDSRPVRLGRDTISDAAAVYPEFRMRVPHAGLRVELLQLPVGLWTKVYTCLGCAWPKSTQQRKLLPPRCELCAVALILLQAPPCNTPCNTLAA